MDAADRTKGLSLRPNVTRLSGTERSMLGALWLGRARAEWEAGLAFAPLRERFRRAALPPALQALLARAPEDEERHARLCHQLATGYGVSERFDVPSTLPRANLDAAEHAFGLCCVGESLGAAALRFMLHEAEDPAVRAVLRDLLRDELGHAQLGWGLLATLAPGRRRELAQRAEGLMKLGREHFATRIAALPEPAVPSHGCPERDGLMRVVDDALASLVRPGLRVICEL